MAIPSVIPPLRTYYDPSLWDRLEPEVHKEREAWADLLLTGRFKTLEESREIVGYLRALEWLFAKAQELTRIED